MLRNLTSLECAKGSAAQKGMLGTQKHTASDLLEALRHRLDATQEDMAGYMGLKPIASNYQRYGRRGLRNSDYLPIEKVRSLAEALVGKTDRHGVPIKKEDILPLAGPIDLDQLPKNNDDNDARIFKVSKGEQNLILALRSLPREKRELYQEEIVNAALTIVTGGAQPADTL